MPLFSIIIPTFNRASSISVSIDSILGQSFSDFELIVVDDGSNDETESLLKNKYGNAVHYFFQQHKGVCAARNHGASLAKGDYLIFLDSDDQLAAGSLNEYASRVTNKKVKLVLGFIAYLDRDFKEIERINPFSEGKKFRHPLTGSFAIERNLFLRQSGYDENLSYSETSDFFLRLSLGDQISESELTITHHAGVLIPKADRKQRKQRYGIKKYASVKYFLEKHRTFFDENPKQFLNFKRIHGMCALQNNLYAEARTCFWQVLKVAPWSWKSYFHFLWVAVAPYWAKWYYGR